RGDGRGRVAGRAATDDHEAHGHPTRVCPPSLRAVPELRRDPLTGAVVILAPGRAVRPDTFRAMAHAPIPTEPDADAGCPFCEGCEDQTPPEVYRTGGGAPNTPGWRVRVVPNLYPIAGDGLAGAHEVAVLSPKHGESFGELDDDDAAELLTVLRDRA